MPECIAEKVVAFSAVPACAASESVVPIHVHNCITLGTDESFREKRYTEPPLDHGFEEKRLDLVVKGSGRHSIQPLVC